MRTPDLVEELRAVVQLAEVHHIDFRSVKRPLRRSEVIEVPLPAGHGWLVGDVLWGPAHRPERHATIIMEQATTPPSRDLMHRAQRVVKDPNHAGYLFAGLVGSARYEYPIGTDLNGTVMRLLGMLPEVGRWNGTEYVWRPAWPAEWGEPPAGGEVEIDTDPGLRAPGGGPVG